MNSEIRHAAVLICVGLLCICIVLALSYAIYQDFKRSQ